MKTFFNEKQILVLNTNQYLQQILIDTMRVMGFCDIDECTTPEAAYLRFQEKNHHIIIGDIVDGKLDIIGLSAFIRGNKTSPNPDVPMLAIAQTEQLNFIPDLKRLHINDLLQYPFGLDDLSLKLQYLLNHDDIPDYSSDHSHGGPNHSDWPSSEESASLTNVMLDHYIKHHEVIFKKLTFAQTATHDCLEDIRSTYEKMRGKDNTNIHSFKDFDQMWVDILSHFVKVGMSEDDLFQIEKVVKTIPKEIRARYDEISQQDKSFLVLVDSLNSSAYRKAKEKVMALQSQPNPLNGKTPSDYKSSNEKKGVNTNAFKFKPKLRGED